MPRLREKPPVSEVVTVSFKGSAQTALGVWNGKTWFVWREANGGFTGEPPAWLPCEDSLLREWSKIPAGILRTLVTDNAATSTCLRMFVTEGNAIHAKAPPRRRKSRSAVYFNLNSPDA